MVPSVVSPTDTPDRDAQREQAVDQRLAELRLGRRVEVDVQRLRVHGERGEEDVVGLGDRAPVSCWNVCPTCSSSKYLPAIDGLLIARELPLAGSDRTLVGGARPHGLTPATIPP